MKVAAGEVAPPEQPPDEKWRWFGSSSAAPSEEAARTAANLAQAREADEATCPSPSPNPNPNPSPST